MTDGYKGAQIPSSAASEFDTMTFVITQILNRANTATLVQIKAVTNAGGVAAVGFVDVQPLVSQVDGYGQAIPHQVVHGLPYFRLQGGANAVILDPQPGDIGIAVFANRDISAVKAKKGAALPGSRRRFDMADGMYLGGLLNGVPSQYVRFTSAGIDIVSPTQIQLQAPAVKIVSDTLTHNDVNVGATHEHGGVSRGSDSTDAPH